MKRRGASSGLANVSTFRATNGMSTAVRLLSLAWITAVRSMIMDVDEGKESCVIIPALEGQKIYANFEVLTPGSVSNVMVILRSKAGGNKGKLLYRQSGKTEESFKREASVDGDYELCFLNDATDAMLKLNNEPVGEEIKRLKESKDGGVDADGSYEDGNGQGYVDDDGTWYGGGSTSKKFGFGLSLSTYTQDGEAEKATTLGGEADEVSRHLSVFNDHLSYLRTREEYHEGHVSQASSRLKWATFVEAGVLVWCSWSQLSYIRRFFETTRVL